MKSLNKEGYAVIGLNAKDYFWTKKNQWKRLPLLNKPSMNQIKNGTRKRLY
jgi:hypothetical protein